MNAIQLKLRKQMDAQEYYHRCARQDALHDHVCVPRPLDGKLIEWEHAMYYQGRELQEEWAIIPLCWWAHSGPGMVKNINRWLAFNRAADEEILAVSKATNYFLMRSNLNKLYGIPPKSTSIPAGINYGNLIK